MAGARGAVVLGLLLAMLATSVDCMPRSMPLPQNHHTGTSDIPSRMQSQQHSNDVASDEAIGAAVGFGRFLLELLLNRASNGYGDSQTTNPGAVPSPYQTARGQLAVVEQSSNDYLIDSLVDELMKEYEEQNTAGGTTAANKQEEDKAVTQIYSETWRNLRECGNDIFTPYSDGTSAEQQRAIINELKSVWMGQTALSQASAQLRVNWPIIRSCIDRFANRNEPSQPPSQAYLNWRPFDKCNSQLFVMAFTGGTTNSQTTDQHYIELTVGEERGLVQLPLVTGLEFQTNKGDLWAIDLTDFGLTDSCIEKNEVDGIAIVEGGTDGWLIASIVTFLQDVDGSFSLLSSDIEVDTWIDGNGRGGTRRRLDLTLD